MAVDYVSLKVRLADIVGGTTGLPTDNEIQNEATDLICVGSDNDMDRISIDGTISGDGVKRFRHDIMLRVLIIHSNDSAQSAEYGIDEMVTAVQQKLENDSTMANGGSPLVTLMYPESVTAIHVGEIKTGRVIRVRIQVTD